VVLNLATAVKELVENSLDAGATVIEIRLREYGSELIEVVDNGNGVQEENFEGLTLKHHTSKLREFSDLVSVETFGFRGEALSSLCALSEMTVITRHSSASCGTRLEFDHHGQITARKPCARQKSTFIRCMSKFFCMLPVRHKEFHRNLRREFTKMTQLLYAYCLVSTGTKITCSNQNKKGSRSVVVSTQGSDTVRENIACVFGSKQLHSLMDFEQRSPDETVLQECGMPADIVSSQVPFQLQGCISSCAHGQGRSSADRQFFYVNSRPCEPTKVVKVVNEVYHQFNQHQYPFVFLNLKMARSSVDVNVTPDKRQVFLDQEKLLLVIIKASLLQMYETIPSTFNFQNLPVTPVTPVPYTSSKGTKRLSEFASKEANKKSKMHSIDRFFSMAKKKEKPESLPLQHDLLNKNKAFVNNLDDDNEIQSSDTDDVQVIIDTESSPNSISQSEKNNILTIDKLNSNEKNNSERNRENNTSNTEILAENENNLIIENTENSSHQNNETTFLSDDNETLYDTSKCIVIKTDYKEMEDVRRKFVHMTVSYDDIKHKIENRKKRNAQNSENKTVVKFRAEIDPSKNKSAEQELHKEISKDMFSKMEILGQFNLGFIVTRLGLDLFIIDQHATDEKYNFEMLQRNTVIQNQKLVIPQKLELTAVNESILIESEEVFRKNGFDFIIDEKAEPTKRIQLTAVPISRNCLEEKGYEMFLLHDSPNTMCRPSRVRAMFASRACRKSVMIGTALSKSDMRRLVNQMGEIEQPLMMATNQGFIKLIIQIVEKHTKKYLEDLYEERPYGFPVCFSYVCFSTISMSTYCENCFLIHLGFETSLIRRLDMRPTMRHLVNLGLLNTSQDCGKIQNSNSNYEQVSKFFLELFLYNCCPFFSSCLFNRDLPCKNLIGIHYNTFLPL
ncbi:hypothetical protein L9F63_015551, partial [Diploptera punctata]